jgi:hypothetical protein
MLKLFYSNYGSGPTEAARHPSRPSTGQGRAPLPQGQVPSNQGRAPLAHGQSAVEIAIRYKQEKLKVDQDIMKRQQHLIDRDSRGLQQQTLPRDGLTRVAPEHYGAGQSQTMGPVCC